MQVRSALAYVAVLFGVEAVACLVVPAGMLGVATNGLPFLGFIVAACAVAAVFGAFRASTAPGEASLVLALVLTTGTLISAMVLGIPGTGSVLAVSFAVLGYGSGAFLTIAAWFASYSLHGAPAIEVRVRRQAESTRAVVDEGTRTDSWAA